MSFPNMCEAQVRYTIYLLSIIEEPLHGDGFYENSS